MQLLHKNLENCLMGFAKLGTIIKYIPYPVTIGFTAVDATGLRALEDVFEKTMKDGTVLILSGIRRQPLAALRRTGLLEKIGRKNVHRHIDKALQRARELVTSPVGTTAQAEKHAATLIGEYRKETTL